MRYFFISLCILFCFSACKKDSGAHPAVLQGTWQEQEQAPSFAGSNYRVQLLGNGTFKMSIAFYTDIANTGNPCDTRTDYIKGEWEVNNGAINFTGFYTDTAYQVNMPNCPGNAGYYASFTYKLAAINTLVFNPQLNEYASIKMTRQ